VEVGVVFQQHGCRNLFQAPSKRPLWGFCMIKALSLQLMLALAKAVADLILVRDEIMPAPQEQRSIRSDPTFYGHIVGLSLERGDLPYSAAFPGKMYARFEHSGQSSTYLVPDWELFTLLVQ
jgi:hypothetical protein